MMDAWNTSTPDALLTLGKVALLLICVGMGWRLGGWCLARYFPRRQPSVAPQPEPEPEPEPPTPIAARRQALRLVSGDVAWSDPTVQQLVRTRRWQVLVGGRGGQGWDEATDPGDEQDADEDGDAHEGRPV